jgi:hypothetical protein
MRKQIRIQVVRRWKRGKIHLKVLSNGTGGGV